MPHPQSAGGDPEDLATEVKQLHERFAAGLLNYASSRAEDAESAADAVQEIFLRYMIERRYGRNVDNPRAWLYRVLHNYLADRRKAASSKSEVPAEGIESIADPARDPESIASQLQMGTRIASTLSGRELECLKLRFEGLSYEEIGAAMKVRSGTVGVLLSRASAKIRGLRDEAGPVGRRQTWQLPEKGSVCIPS